MTDVSIIGIGQTKVGEHWETSIRHLAWYAIEAAMDDAATSDIEALYVGNMMAGALSHQDHLGALVADFSLAKGDLLPRPGDVGRRRELGQDSAIGHAAGEGQ